MLSDYFFVGFGSRSDCGAIGVSTSVDVSVSLGRSVAMVWHAEVPIANSKHDRIAISKEWIVILINKRLSL